MFHIADPDAFFLPIDRFNERYEELAAIPTGLPRSHYSKDELLSQRAPVFARHPNTTFVARTWRETGEPDLSRPPAFHLPECFCRYECQDCRTGPSTLYRPRFFSKTCRRILFSAPISAHHRDVPIAFPFSRNRRRIFRVSSHASRQGRWNIYGLHLPDDVLRKIYRENALRLFACVADCAIAATAPQAAERAPLATR